MTVTLSKMLRGLFISVTLLGATSAALSAQGQAAPAHAGGEASLVLPDLSTVSFLGGSINGWSLLTGGLLISALGLLFGLMTFARLKNLPVHASMREVSELIYETCKTYLITQGRFILILWVFIGSIAVVYFGFLAPTVNPVTGAAQSGFP